MKNIFENFIKIDELLKILHENNEFSEYSFSFHETTIDEEFRYRLYIKKKSEKSETNDTHPTSILITQEGGIEEKNLPRLIQILKDNIEIKKYHKQL